MKELSGSAPSLWSRTFYLTTPKRKDKPVHVALKRQPKAVPLEISVQRSPKGATNQLVETLRHFMGQNEWGRACGLMEHYITDEGRQVYIVGEVHDMFERAFGVTQEVAATMEVALCHAYCADYCFEPN